MELIELIPIEPIITIDNKSETDNTVVSDDKQDQKSEEVVEVSNGRSRPRESKGKQKEDQSDDEKDPVKAFLEKWKFEDPGICCVCLEGATAEENMLVYCDGQEYPWYCDKCLAKPSEVVSCILCPKKTGAFRRLQEEEGFKTDAWVHLVCALWMPGMWIANTQGLNECSIISVEKTNWIKDCCICPKELASQGATVHCDAGGCKNWIHVTCAQSYNLLEYEDDSEMSDPYFVYCKEHCSQAGTVRLNEWERWILKRDKFLDNVRSEELQKRNNKLTSELIDQGKILREIFEDNYSEYQKRREKQIVKLRKNVAQLYSEYKGDKDKISRGEEQIESLEQKKRTVKSETIELANYLNRLRFRVKAFVEKMIKKDADDSNIINNNVEIKQYTECSTYKEAERQIRDGLIEKSMIEIQRLLAKLPNSISDWNNNNVEEAKTINIKKLDIEEIETLGLDNAQKILVQRQKERKQKGKKGKKTTTTATNNGKNELTNQLKKAYNTGMVPFPASRKNISDLINLPENNNSTIITTTSRMSASSPSKNSKNKKKNSSEIFKDTYDYYSNKKVRNDDDEYYNSHSGNINGNKNRSKIIYGSIISGTIENTIFSGSSNHSNRNVRKRSQKKPLMRKRKKNGNSSDSSQQQYKLPSRYPQPICFKCDRIEPPDDYQPPSYVKNTKASNLMLEKKGRDTVNRMIRCNFCTKWYHLACMNPPRKTMPIG
ncbi:2797_t:CDS:10 [Entrophospora sp. SA101]|nr:2797_t:CDS:10 [Entrophospora sp. SA101]